MSGRAHIFKDAVPLAVEYGRTVEDEDDEGMLHDHPEFPDRHTLKVMLADGDKLPPIAITSEITIIITTKEQ